MKQLAEVKTNDVILTLVSSQTEREREKERKKKYKCPMSVVDLFIKNDTLGYF